MNFLRKHWYDLGGLFAIAIIIFLIQAKDLKAYDYIVWLSLLSLFLHQLEEYRFAGTFPGMVNKVMYNSSLPDRYPLNSNTSLIINVAIGWTVYFLAAVCSEKAVWIGIASIMISLGNITAHTFIFNIRGKTIYNAGLLSCWLLFAPCIYFFLKIMFHENLATKTDWLIGIPLGIVLNVIGILKLIDRLADKNTGHIFEQRNLLPNDRLNKNNSLQ